MKKKLNGENNSFLLSIFIGNFGIRNICGFTIAENIEKEKDNYKTEIFP
jgi:hypothetical protein